MDPLLNINGPSVDHRTMSGPLRTINGPSVDHRTMNGPSVDHQWTGGPMEHGTMSGPAVDHQWTICGPVDHRTMSGNAIIVSVSGESQTWSETMPTSAFGFTLKAIMISSTSALT